MAFPDRIERTVEVAQPPARVWTALTTSEGLAAWFGDKATVDLRQGGKVEMSWDGGGSATMRIECIDDNSIFGFTWSLYGLSADDPRRSYVEFRLQPTADGGTRLDLVESGFAQLTGEEHSTSYGANTQAWKSELGDLLDHLGAG